MPFDRKRYPKDWKEISQRIRFERAGGKCEECGVAHGAVGARDRFDTWHDEDDIQGLWFSYPKMTKIVLTTAHIGAPHADGSPGDKHDKMDCRDENLKALCQRCHLRLDQDEHIENAARTRRQKKRSQVLATGQQELFEPAGG